MGDTLTLERARRRKGTLTWKHEPARARIWSFVKKKALV
jgi:hypothetical protein